MGRVGDDVDDRGALRLQVEWGADEALLDAPLDRFSPLPAAGAAAAAIGGPAAWVERAAAAPGPLPFGPAAGAVSVAGAANDLAGLHAALDGFSACPLRATASRTVAPSGNPAAGLVMVAEAPGPEDDRAGMAFSGAPGERLDRVLRSAGLTRDALLLTMLVPWRPPGGRPVNEAEVAACLPFLRRLLVLTRPRHLVLLGAGPLRALAGAELSFRKARGRWTDLVVEGLETPVALMPMQPPELWLSSPANRQSTWAELLCLVGALRDGVPDSAP